MANDTRVRADFVAGALDAALLSSGTTMSSPALADLPAIGSAEHTVIALARRDANGRVTQKEIVHVTAHSAGATTATIARAREDTTAQGWIVGDRWSHGGTRRDFPTPVFDVRNYGAKGTGSTDDTAAIQAAADAAFPAGSQAAGILYFPPGNYKITSRITIGSATQRYFGVHIRGAGRFSSQLTWAGGTTDFNLHGCMYLQNCHNPTVEKLTFNEWGTRAQYGLWFFVGDGKSGFMPRVDDCVFQYLVDGIRVGGGAMLSTGQCNQGSYFGCYFWECDNGALLTGPNSECHLFYGCNWANEVTTNAKGIKSLNVRGISVKGFEADFAGEGNPIMLYAEGGNLFSGGFTVEDGRIEDCWGLIHVVGSGGGTNYPPTQIAARRVFNNRFYTTRTDPCDMILCGYSGVITCVDLLWAQTNSRIRFTGLKSGTTTADSADIGANATFGTARLTDCMVNNTGGMTNPTSLITMDVASPAGSLGGLRGYIEGSLNISANGSIGSGNHGPIGAFPDRKFSQTQDQRVVGQHTYTLL